MAFAKKVISISAPNFKVAVVSIEGTAPLVIKRFSEKVKEEMLAKMEAGKAAGSRKNRDPKSAKESYEKSKYVTKEGWEGFRSVAIRNACISACRLVGFRMTLAKMAIFDIPDGWDKFEPQMSLYRIEGKSVQQEDMARTATGDSYITVRAAYHKWKAKIRIKWDADQFTESDIYNLMYRVGAQVGIGEGRPDSKNSAGMGWGLFKVKGVDVYPYEDK